VWDDVVDRELAELLDGGYDEPTPPVCECIGPDETIVHFFSTASVPLGVCNECKRIIA